MLLQNQSRHSVKPKTTTPPQNQTHHSKVNLLNSICVEQLDSVLTYLGIRFKKQFKYYTARCPIHGGDNNNAIQIYTQNGKIPGLWRCCTNHCENKHPRNIIGFIQATLEVPQYKAIQLICSHLGVNFDTLEVDESQVDKLKFAQLYQPLDSQPTLKLTRDEVRSSLLIPSPLFIERGFSRSLLDRYDVGVCVTRGEKFFTRTIVPIYDEQHKYSIACAARNPNPKCDKCNYHHSVDYQCPTTDYQRYISSKWINDGVTSETLFNYWYAKYYIAKSKVAILTEGVPDCLKLEQVGIKNSVAVFGNYLNNGQARLLDKLGVTTLICLFDNDKGGEEGKRAVIEQYSKHYKLHFPDLLQNGLDIGETSSDIIVRDIKPTLKHLTRSN